MDDVVCIGILYSVPSSVFMLEVRALAIFHCYYYYINISLLLLLLLLFYSSSSSSSICTSPSIEQ